MEPKSLSNVEWQAIINITPDSFSDGGVNNSPASIEYNIKKLYGIGCRHFDFGAQSTAPTSEGISLAQELNRFETNFFPILKNQEMVNLLNNCRLSFDTFRGATLFKLLDTLDQEKLTPKEVIWNDVSGVVSADVVQFLKRKNSSYVLCHNLAGCRENASQHMNFTSKKMGDDFIHEMGSYFRDRIEMIPSVHLEQIIIDPCFGFSKTSHQNIHLLGNLGTFGGAVGGNYRYLFGVSRKKFLRELSGFNLDKTDQLDQFQSDILSRSLSEFPYFCYIRSHSKPL